MQDDSRVSDAVQAAPHRIKRQSANWLLACALGLSSLLIAPGVQAKAEKPAAGKSSKEAKAPAKAGKDKVAAKSERSSKVSRADKAGKAERGGKHDKADLVAKSSKASKADRQSARSRRGDEDERVAKRGKSGKGKTTAMALADSPRDRKSIREDRLQRVSLDKPSRAEPALRAPARVSYAERAGLDQAIDGLGLKASVAFVIDQDSNEVLLAKNEHAVLPIASITKLMTGLLVSEAKQPLDETITITEADVDTLKGTRSRLPVGTQLSRGELLHLALMSSENRAAHALGRTYPGGLGRFVAAMNAKASLLGMQETRYVEPTGLSSENQSSAADLARLAAVASRDPLLSALTTSPGFEVALGNHFVQFNNTNRLVHEPSWSIGLQKTGYISEAGQCLVMQSKVNGRNVVMVFLDSASTRSRIADAQRVRSWMEDRGMAVAHRAD
jgi:D-alanyl-D-alanine endopeptidase (penicillin-binding protein 7)